MSAPLIEHAQTVIKWYPTQTQQPDAHSEVRKTHTQAYKNPLYHGNALYKMERVHTLR